MHPKPWLPCRLLTNVTGRNPIPSVWEHVHPLGSPCGDFLSKPQFANISYLQYETKAPISASLSFFLSPQDVFAVNGPWNEGLCPSYGSFDPPMQEEIKKHPAMPPWSLRWVINSTRGTLRRQLWHSSEELSCPLHPQERTKCTSEGAMPFLQLVFKMVSRFCSNAVLPKNQIHSWNSSWQQLSVPKIHNW